MDGQIKITTETRSSHLNSINSNTLIPLIRRALNSYSVTVFGWNYEQLHGGAGVGSTIYRLFGDGYDQSHKIAWSLILKVIHPGDNTINSSDWNYYRREFFAYKSGWFDDLPGDLVAPRCLGTFEHPDGTCWIWLEEITDAIGLRWPLKQYGIAARHLGRFNGAYLMERALPHWSWLSSRWLRGYITRSGSVLPLLQNSLEHPLVRRWLPDNMGSQLLRLWGERDTFLNVLERLPQTICHHDAFRRNLFAQQTENGDMQTMIIDWAYTGQGALGEELVPLILASVYFFEVDLSQALELENIVFDGYVSGLRDAGWQGDQRRIRLAYAVAATLRYNFGEMERILTVILDKNKHPSFQRIFGRSIEETLGCWGEINLHFSGLIDEARSLMKTLD